MIPDLKTLHETHQRIKSYVHHTPVLTSATLDTLTGISLFFKCENFQKVGAFKARGGFNAILSLSTEAKAAGVTAHSSGNHAQAVALAAKTVGIPAYIIMPSNAPKVKQAAVKDYGAEIIFCEPTLAARESTVNQVIEEKHAVLIHPYNDYHIIAGQATAAIELLKQVNSLDYLLTPVGGGGLISGSALACKYLSPTTRVIGCEPAGADDGYRSFKAGKLQQHTQAPASIADGLLSTLGDRTFDIIQREVDDILLVSEEEIIVAMKLVWERMKIIIEPSSAVPVAAAIRYSNRFEEKRVGIIISGGNVDLGQLPFS